MDTIFVTQYHKLQPQPEEILRYAGLPKTAEPDPLMLSCLDELGEIDGRICWRHFDIARREDGSMDLGFCVTPSKNLAQNLKDCSRLVLFAGTLGLPIDRLLERYGRLSPAKQLWFQAIGAAGVEALCDRFCEDVKHLAGRGGALASTKPRYSPGFGDFGLSYQKSIFAALDCQRRIGLTLTDSLLMSPTKSVTALIGIRDEADHDTQRVFTK